MDLCLSCKACKSECPSNVDVAKLKAEFLQQYYDTHGVPLRSRLIANITSINRLGSLLPGVFNFFMDNNLFTPAIMSMMGFAPQRRMPLLAKYTLKNWMAGYVQDIQPAQTRKTVYLFNDEFTNYNDTTTGVRAIQLLNRLGYEVKIPQHLESGRTYLSKGLIRKAKKIARKNVSYLKDIISEQVPLIGIEPSAILTFRDEYPDLLTGDEKEAARQIANNALMFDEFIVKEKELGFIRAKSFTEAPKKVLLHGHCQQKAVASTLSTINMLSIPENYEVEEIPSGCCGMAGSFGYEKEHYEVSQKIGEMVLFPAVRNASEETIITAPGTSCRHQIKEGTERIALHPIDVLYMALEK